MSIEQLREQTIHQTAKRRRTDRAKAGSWFDGFKDHEVLTLAVKGFAL
jgi:hypothetical protein